MRIKVDAKQAIITEHETLTVGSRGIMIGLEFSPDWDSLAKTALFWDGVGEPIPVLIFSDFVEIPAELTASNVLKPSVVFKGVASDGSVVYPAVECPLGSVWHGIRTGGYPVEPPTPDWTAQIEAAVREAVETANGVRADADAGKFKGDTGPAGPKGDNGAAGPPGKQGPSGITVGPTPVDPPAEDTANIDPDVPAFEVPTQAEFEQEIQELTSTKLSGPAPTEADEGKVLTVVDGKAVWAKGGGIPEKNHRIDYNLNKASSSNREASVKENTSYTTTLTADEGLTLSGVSVTMGGKNITAQAWKAPAVTISAVTGDVVITAEGVAQIDTSPVIEVVGKGINSQGRQYAKEGWGYTKFYPVKDTQLTLFMTNNENLDKPTSNAVMTVVTNTQSTANPIPVVSSINTGGDNWGTEITSKPFEVSPESGIRATLVVAEKENAYVYETNTGDIVFAGKNTRYYGLKNVSEAVSPTPVMETADSPVMMSFDRVYVDDGVHKPDMPAKWDGMFSIHRGFSTAHDNTLQAFLEAKKHGYNCCEMDLRKTSDGVYVLSHDPSITGTVDGVSTTYVVADTPWATLKELVIGNSKYPDSRVPSMEETFAFCRRIGMRAEIDYKLSDPESHTAMVEMSRLYGMQDDTLHCCYTIDLALAVKAAYGKANLRVAGAQLDNDRRLDEWLDKPGNIYAYYSASSCGKSGGSNAGNSTDNESRIPLHKKRGYKMYVWNVTPSLLPDVMQWHPDILQPNSSKDKTNWYEEIRKLNQFPGIVW